MHMTMCDFYFLICVCFCVPVCVCTRLRLVSHWPNYSRTKPPLLPCFSLKSLTPLTSQQSQWWTPLNSPPPRSPARPDCPSQYTRPLTGPPPPPLYLLLPLVSTSPAKSLLILPPPSSHPPPPAHSSILPPLPSPVPGELTTQGEQKHSANINGLI